MEERDRQAEATTRARPVPLEERVAQAVNRASTITLRLVERQ